MPDMSVLDDILVEIAETAKQRRSRRSVESPSSVCFSGVRGNGSSSVTHGIYDALPHDRAARKISDEWRQHGTPPQSNGSSSQTFPRRYVRSTNSDVEESDSSGTNAPIKTDAIETQNTNGQTTHHIPCPFGTYLNLDFVQFCSGLTRGRLPESIKLYRKSSSQRKKKWRKSMDQMLYGQELSDSAQGAEIRMSPTCNVAAVTENRDCVDSAGELAIPQNVYHDLDEVVETFEETFQHHLTLSKKKRLRSVEERVEEDDQTSSHSVHFAETQIVKPGDTSWLMKPLGETVSRDTPAANSEPSSSTCSTLSSDSGLAKPHALTIKSPKLDRESLFTIPPCRTPKSALSSSFNREICSSLPDIKARSVTPLCMPSLSRNSNGSIPAEALESIREKLATGVLEMQRLQKEADQVPLLKAEIIQLKKALQERNPGANPIQQQHRLEPSADSSADQNGISRKLQVNGVCMAFVDGKAAEDPSTEQQKLSTLLGQNGPSATERSPEPRAEYRRPSIPNLSIANGVLSPLHMERPSTFENGTSQTAVTRVQHILDAMTRNQQERNHRSSHSDSSSDSLPQSRCSGKVFCDIGIQSDEAFNVPQATSSPLLPSVSSVDVGVSTENEYPVMVSQEVSADIPLLPTSETRDAAANTDESVTHPPLRSPKTIKFTPQKNLAVRAKFRHRRKRKQQQLTAAINEALDVDQDGSGEDLSLNTAAGSTPAPDIVLLEGKAPESISVGVDDDFREIPQQTATLESEFPNDTGDLETINSPSRTESEHSSAHADWRNIPEEIKESEIFENDECNQKQPDGTVEEKQSLCVNQGDQERETCSVHSQSSSSDGSSGSLASDDEGSYDLRHGHLSNKCPVNGSDKKENGSLPHTFTFDTYMARHSMSKEVLAACKVLNDYLHRHGQASWALTNRFDQDTGTHRKNDRKEQNSSKVERSVRMIEEEWFAVAGRKEANAQLVNDYLDAFESMSKALLYAVVNLTDVNGNTVLHYALSHNNFDVVSILLDSKVCDVDIVNKAGYSTVMLASLANMSSSAHQLIAARLFHLGDINRKAQQHGQTALMLAVSHGRLETVRMLLQVGADVNIQDNDGSTALMCASEHGHLDIVRLLLDHPDMDPHLTDQDGMCALYVALEAGHKDVAALIYAKTTTGDAPTLAHSASGPELHSEDQSAFETAMKTKKNDELRGLRSRFSRGRGKGTSTM